MEVVENPLEQQRIKRRQSSQHWSFSIPDSHDMKLILPLILHMITVFPRHAKDCELSEEGCPVGCPKQNRSTPDPKSELQFLFISCSICLKGDFLSQMICYAAFISAKVLPKNQKLQILSL